MQNPIVFTDLDGTLLDHYSYSFNAAKEMLSYLKESKIPLIIVTSKTKAEVLKLQERLGIHQPFIAENGAGIFIPSDSQLAASTPSEEEWIRLVMGKSYLEVRLFVNVMQERFPIRGFADLSVEEVIALTGLDEETARNAMQRDFTEPFLIDDKSMIPALTVEANKAGLDIVRGGRFHHIITLAQDKANAVRRLSQLYGELYGRHPEVIALGDSENDFTMLRFADIPVLIPRPNGSYAAISLSKMSKAPYPGPKGWNHVLKELFDVS
jgi:mannosyl-3-phosphoglycerate phosphatase